MLTTLTTFIVVLIGWSNADPFALRSSRSLSETNKYGGDVAVGGIEEVSIGHSSNTDLRMPSRRTLLLEQQQPQAAAALEDDKLLRRSTKTTRESTLVAPASADAALSEKNLLGEVDDWEQHDKKMIGQNKAYEIPIHVITVSILRDQFVIGALRYPNI